MKENALALGKWFVVAAILVAVGVMLAAGMGRRRGTRTYRWRVALWGMLLTLLGAGTALTASSCDKLTQNTCYVPAIPDDYLTTDSKDSSSPDSGMMCYAQDPDPRPEEVRSTCYIDLTLPDISQPDPGPTCYLPEIGSEPEASPGDAKDSNYQGFDGVTCYKPIAPDVIDEATSIQPDMAPTCYIAIAPDTLHEPEVTTEEDAGGEDVPGPTCYAPPLE